MSLLELNGVRVTRLVLPCLAAPLLVAAGCSSSGGSGGGSGGAVGTGGMPIVATGGASTGAAPSTGGLPGGSGGSSTGGTGTGGSGTGGLNASGGGGGAGGASGGTSNDTGGAVSTGGSGAAQACAHDCVDDCATWGGTEQAGVCGDGQQCCEGATIPPVNPLAHLATSAEQIGQLLANRFKIQGLTYTTVKDLPGDGYKTACEWYGSLRIAGYTQDSALVDALVTKFDPLKTNFVQAMFEGDAHVDRYIYGMVPLEIYLQTTDASYLTLGTETADKQQVTNQTRDAIDDMFMMTGLQLEAYRATGDAKYIDFMSDTMVDYLTVQQANGLFFHNVTQGRVHWGRGNGWFASGMAEMLRDLPPSHKNYATIETGYKKMMQGLVTYQGPAGLWFQVLDMPDDPMNWEETSSSAMFTYAMVAGVRRGILAAADYVPVIEAAWAGLQTKISAQGDVSAICEGTWYHATAAEYMALGRLTGDGHGQAPVLWAAAELLR